VEEQDPRPLRLQSALLALGVAACFLLPFLSVEAPGRSAAARGYELVADDARFTGRYRHAAFEGEVENAIDVSTLPSRFAFVGVVASAALALLPGRRTLWSAFAASALALLGLLWFFQASSLPYAPPVSERQVGAWLALLGSVGLVSLLAWRLRRERFLGPEPPDLFANRR
jgi:hypothetical protein